MLAELAGLTLIHLLDTVPVGPALVLMVLLHSAGNIPAMLMKKAKRIPSQSFLWLSVVFDLCCFAGLLTLTSGINSGTVSVLLIPVALSAIWLSRSYAWGSALIAIAFYTLLMKLTPPSHHHNAGFADHLYGMWLSFVFCVLLITWFINNQSRAIRQQQQSINTLKESQLRDEQILAVATSTANAVHQLATPLSTARLLADELAELTELSQVDEVQKELTAALAQCHAHVHKIATDAREQKPGRLRQTQLGAYVSQTLASWQLTRPEVEVKAQIPQCASDIEVKVDLNLDAALSNLLDNAAEASLENQSPSVALELILEKEYLVLEIRDQGPGLPEEIAQKLGEAPLSSQKQGLGLGYFLANATIERLGGRIWLHNTNPGLLTRVELPLAKLGYPL